MARSFLGRLGGDEKGASIVEFALFIPILSLMLMGITDLAMAYSTKLTAEGAIYRGLEKVIVGTVQTDYQYLKAEVAGADGSGGIQAADVTVDNWLECNRTRQASFTGSCAEGQDTARYVAVTVATSYTPRFGWGPLVTNSAGVVPISANTALRIQ